jgi:acetyl esterase/lipase
MPSLLSRLIEQLVLLSGFKRALASEVALKRYVARQRERRPSSPSRRMRHLLTVGESTLNGSSVFSIAPLGEAPGKHLLYLHGGAHVLAITPLHWRFIARLVRHSGCAAAVPLYPLAPEHGRPAVLEVIVPLFEQMVGPENLIIMGDSAGGNLALSLVQELRNRGRRLPARLILISPWLDLTLPDPRQAELAHCDCMLDIPRLRAAGCWYAGDLSPADLRLSSLYGSLLGLPPIAVFTGTRDLLNPDARRLNEKAAQQGVSLTLYEYEGMFHIFPMAPIREARQAIREMKLLIWNAPEK